MSFQPFNGDLTGLTTTALGKSGCLYWLFKLVIVCVKTLAEAVPYIQDNRTDFVGDNYSGYGGGIVPVSIEQ